MYRHAVSTPASIPSPLPAPRRRRSHQTGENRQTASQGRMGYGGQLEKHQSVTNQTLAEQAGPAGSRAEKKVSDRYSATVTNSASYAGTAEMPSQPVLPCVGSQP